MDSQEGDSAEARRLGLEAAAKMKGVAVPDPQPMMVTLKSNDGQEFRVETAAIYRSEMIQGWIAAEATRQFITLPQVTGAVLAKVVEYLMKHFDEDAKLAEYGDFCLFEDSIDTWDAEFVNVDQKTLLDLILAADYLKINSLLDLCCKAVANMMKGKTLAEIRAIFDIKNDYTPEEEEELQKKIAWALQ